MRNASLDFAQALVKGAFTAKDQIAAIHLYTTEEIHTPLNKALQQARQSKKAVPAKFLPFTKLLFEALSKLPDYDGVVYRGINARLDHIAKGRECLWGAFSSCSTDGGVVKEGFLESNDYRTLFAIADPKAKEVRQYSAHDSEAEVILQLGSRLRVDNHIYLGQRLMLVNLTQLG